MRELLIRLFFCFPLIANSQDIFDAARSGNTALIDSLFRIDQELINSKNEDGFTPLILAVYRSHNKAVEQLIELGASVNETSPEGTALHAACYTNNSYAAKVLLEHGGEPNVTTQDGTTPLHYAVTTNNKDLVILMLDHGADKSATDANGLSPLDLCHSKSIRKVLR